MHGWGRGGRRARGAVGRAALLLLLAVRAVALLHRAVLHLVLGPAHGGLRAARTAVRRGLRQAAAFPTLFAFLLFALLLRALTLFLLALLLVTLLPLRTLLLRWGRPILLLLLLLRAPC